jgi:broad specificity phosphatase PhoE
MPFKNVYLVRHAESAENALMQGVARSWAALTQFSLPALSDVKSGMELASAMVRGTTDECPLSTNGEAQVVEVKKLLFENEETLNVFRKEPVLIVCSPMLRAKLTCEGLFREFLSPSSRVVELESLREILPADYVAPSRWTVVQRRITDFEQWIAQQKEPNIVVVGHSHYFRTMLGIDFKFSNCEIWKARFNTDYLESTDPRKRWSDLVRLCGSSTAKATFGAEGPDAWENKSSPMAGSPDEEKGHRN